MFNKILQEATSNNLSLEQSFTLAKFKGELEQMSPEQAKELLYVSFEHLLKTQNMNRVFVKYLLELDQQNEFNNR